MLNLASFDIAECVNNADINALLSLVEQIKCEGIQIVEIGCWKGFTTAHLAEAAKELHGVVWAIDHWRGNEGTAQEKIVSQTDIYALFEKNLRSLGLWSVVKPLKMDSISASKYITDGSIDFVFIDAGHRYDEFSADLTAWYPKVKVGGIICGHDCETLYEDLSESEQVTLRAHGNIDFYSSHYHAGVIVGLWDYFHGGASKMPASRIWYKKIA